MRTNLSLWLCLAASGCYIEIDNSDTADTGGWVDGSAPDCSILSPLDGSAVGAGALTLEGTASDVESDPDQLEAVWTDSAAGELGIVEPTSEGDIGLTTEALAVGPHVLTLEVTDPDGHTCTDEVTFDVEAAPNGVPSAPAISIVPSTPSTNDDLVVSIDVPSVDPEGDEVTYLYEWSVDGTVSAASTSATLPASATGRDEQWTVTVTPTDGIASGPSAAATVTIANTAPAVTLTVGPDGAIVPVYTDSLVTASASAVDDDGDLVTLTYAWSVNGAPVDEASDTLDGNTFFAKGDTLDLTVTASDGTEATELAWNAVVANSPPRAPVIAVAPGLFASDGDALQCDLLVDAVDPDGDVVDYTFSWDVDGVIFPNPSTTLYADDTIDAVWTTPAEIWTCAVLSSDGTDSGPPRAAQIEIQ
jgi:hypothetical protein